MTMVKFLPSGKVVDAKAGEALLDIALSHDVSIQHACGGFCACTTCHCEILEGSANLETPGPDELERLEVLENRTEHSRLACQSKLKGGASGALLVRVVNFE